MSQFVTANFNKSTSPGTQKWLSDAMAQGVSVIFGQEMPEQSLVQKLADEHRYRLLWPDPMTPSGNRPSAALLVSGELLLEPAPDKVKQILGVFGRYVAPALVNLPELGDTLCISFHASPKVVSADDLALWPGEKPKARHGSTDGTLVANHDRLYYSDLVVEALRLISETTDIPVVAAGDLNEARLWDEKNVGESWGAEMFDLVERAELHNMTWELWGEEERRTRFHSTHPEYQLDYFFVTDEVSRRATSANVDAGWKGSDQRAADGLSDHAPVWLDF